MKTKVEKDLEGIHVELKKMRKLLEYIVKYMPRDMHEEARDEDSQKIQPTI